MFVTGSTALHLSAYHGLDDVVDMLLRKGADITIKDINGHVALHVSHFLELSTEHFKFHKVSTK